MVKIALSGLLIHPDFNISCGNTKFNKFVI
ncbi:Uncharacterised protein [Shigella sonnei]|nr:Uncharacterised protein [Shigella sonnei]